MGIVRQPSVWSGMMATLVAACSPAEADVGFLASDSYFSGAQNCATLERISASRCAGETFGVHCVWGERFGRLFSVSGITMTPALTCDAGLALALRQATDEGLRCEILDEVITNYEIQCGEEDSGDSGDSGELDTCSALWACSRL